MEKKTVGREDADVAWDLSRSLATVPSRGGSKHSRSPISIKYFQSHANYLIIWNSEELWLEIIAIYEQYCCLPDGSIKRFHEGLDEISICFFLFNIVLLWFPISRELVRREMQGDNTYFNSEIIEFYSTNVIDIKVN